MLRIDLTKTSNKIQPVLSERILLVNPILSLVLHSDFTHKTYVITLPENTSIRRTRYDEFTLYTEDLPDLEVGFYHFKIYETTSAFVLSNVSSYNQVKLGILEVTKSVIEDEYLSPGPSETEDDIITYNPYD